MTRAILAKLPGFNESMHAWPVHHLFATTCVCSSTDRLGHFDQQPSGFPPIQWAIVSGFKARVCDAGAFTLRKGTVTTLCDYYDNLQLIIYKWW
jgi:hypothetical protein